MRADSDDNESAAHAGGKGEEMAVGARVRVHPGTAAESMGVIVEDFGELCGLDVHVGANQIANRARRWAVASEDGTLAFVDSDQITAD
jgi:hypothetical protein